MIYLIYLFVASTVLFADDTTMYTCGLGYNEFISILNEELVKVSEFIRANV